MAPVAGEEVAIGDIADGTAPREPPPPLPIAREPPVFRPLKVYAFDPSLGRMPGNVMTIPVRYEKLRPGPVGGRVVVVDYDASRDCFYDPVDLDDPLVAIRGGLDPSESDPHFHQQMAYAVTCETLRRVESALGRTARRRTPGGAAPLGLYVYPHAMMEPNAFAMSNGVMMLGYFRAVGEATGRTVPGQTVFTCLSHDVIVNTAIKAIVSAIRADLVEGSDPGDGEAGLDLAAFYEGFADIAALLLHFSYREAVLDTIQRTAGSIHRSMMGENDAGASGARIQAEVAVGNPLLAIGHGFGEALGHAGALRRALEEKPDPNALKNTREPHERGSILVAALLDAFFTVYVQRSLDLLRIYRAGGGRLEGGDLPAPLAERLFTEVDAVATRMFDTCVRALDYCPAPHFALGDFLRACITADYEHAPADTWGLRDALMLAFRRRGLKPAAASFFSEEALRWPLVDAGRLSAAGPAFVGLPEPDEAKSEQNQRALRTFVEDNGPALGLRPGGPLEIYPLEVARVATAHGTLHVALSTQVVDRSRRKGQPPHGVSLVFDGTGKLRYAIQSSLA